MAEPTTISFVATKELKKQIEQWAADEDRSVSFILRRILEREVRRRRAALSQNQTVTRQADPLTCP